MTPAMRTAFEVKWAIVARLAARVTAAFRSDEASELLDPAVWIFLHLDPPAIEVIEDLQHKEHVANKRVVQPREEPRALGRRMIYISDETTTYNFEGPRSGDPRRLARADELGTKLAATPSARSETSGFLT